MRRASKWRSPWSVDSGIGLHPEQILDAPDGSMDVLRLGRGEPIVLVPGLAGGWQLLLPLAHVLARSHQVYLVGLIGDRSIFPRGLPGTVGGQASELANVLDRLGLERPTMLGVSYGGAVALELAIQQPGRLGGLILSGVGARFERQWAAGLARRVLEKYPLPPDNPFLNQFFNLLHGRKVAPGPETDFVLRCCWRTDQAVMAARLRALEDFDVSDRLWRIETPSLVVAGGRDVVVPPDRQRSLASAIGTARFHLLTGAGHLGFLTSRREFARLSRRYLRATRTSYC